MELRRYSPRVESARAKARACGARAPEGALPPSLPLPLPGRSVSSGGGGGGGGGGPVACHSDGPPRPRLEAGTTDYGGRVSPYPRGDGGDRADPGAVREGAGVQGAQEGRRGEGQAHQARGAQAGQEGAAAAQGGQGAQGHRPPAPGWRPPADCDPAACGWRCGVGAGGGGAAGAGAAAARAAHTGRRIAPWERRERERAASETARAAGTTRPRGI